MEPCWQAGSWGHLVCALVMADGCEVWIPQPGSTTVHLLAQLLLGAAQHPPLNAQWTQVSQPQWATDRLPLYPVAEPRSLQLCDDMSALG